ncbi:MAG: hypothetical protein WBG32_00665 [Nodosilinea sp.]
MRTAAVLIALVVLALDLAAPGQYTFKWVNDGQPALQLNYPTPPPQ